MTEKRQEKRRDFLKTAASVTAGLAMACSPESEAMAAEAAIAESSETTAGVDESPMPTLELGQHKLSRLMVGSNPIHGYSHFNSLYSKHMLEWSTPDHVCKLMDRCWEVGINTWQFSHHERAMRDLKEHRKRGGKMQWILLSHSEIENDHSLIKEVAKLSPIGIVHHGGSAERKRRQGKVGQVRDFLKAVRDSGVKVGLSTHDPEFLDQAESEGWDVDFYMTALYYLTRSDEEFQKLMGTRPLGEIYLPEDPARMCNVIRQTPRTCLTYKVLAAGRLSNSPEQINKAFRFTLENIKPNDGMIIGMYPRYTDQVGENAGQFKKIAGELQA
jgi:hypothetical protein